jgi:hypothetical protein
MPFDHRGTRLAGIALLSVLAPAFIAAVQAQPVQREEDGTVRREIRCGPDVQTSVSPNLKLTEEQCLLIGQSVPVLAEAQPPERRETAFEAMESRSGIGRPPPRGTQPATLPTAVTSRFPQLSRYSYFVTKTDIALVDPGTNLVVALVEVNISPQRTRN